MAREATQRVRSIAEHTRAFADMRAVLVALLWMARASGLRSGPPIAWSIAGSDSGGGAGVEADLRTFRALGVHGCAVVTSLTAQNSLGVAAALETPPSHVAATIAALESDLAPACVKVGMLSGAGAAREVAAFLERNAACRLVLDPVLAEAEALLGLEPGSVRTAGDVEAAAAAFLGRFGCGSVLLKGGHVDLGDAADFWTAETAPRGSRAAASRASAPAARTARAACSSALAAALRAATNFADAVVVAKAFCGAAIAPRRRAARGRRRRTRRRRGRAARRDVRRAARGPGPAPRPPRSARRRLRLCAAPSSGALRGAVGRGRARRPAPRQGARRDAVAAEVEAAPPRRARQRLWVNDDWRLAARFGAFGAHLGQEDLAALGDGDLAELRDSGLRLGVSTHCLSELAVAAALAPSYVALGPVFGTTSKHVPFSPRGLDLVSDWRALVPGDVPLVAIGGVTLERAAGVLHAGADGIAVISALPEDGLAEAAASWTALWDR
ncbi:hydroxymethylpyrimidine kinase [Aureococcus anophagefferens]|nr:hydroxymethylpyrimidine kinase [Aureococcus anophagefferens]